MSLFLPVILAGILTSTSFQFSGINIIMQYTVEIFESADSSINEYLATIFVGVALLVS